MSTQGTITCVPEGPEQPAVAYAVVAAVTALNELTHYTAACGEVLPWRELAVAVRDLAERQELVCVRSVLSKAAIEVTTTDGGSCTYTGAALPPQLTLDATGRYIHPAAD